MPEQTLDNAVGTLAGAAEAAIEPVVVSNIERFAARGHEIISENMARARVLAASYPAVGVLIPVIESTLRSLLSHLLAGPDAPVPELPVSRVESAAPVLARRPGEIASDAPPAIAASDLPPIESSVPASDDPVIPPAPGTTDPAFPPVRDDKVPAPEAPPAV